MLKKVVLAAIAMKFNSFATIFYSFEGINFRQIFLPTVVKYNSTDDHARCKKTIVHLC